ncbi:MAG: nucleotidyl transferase AbiEii/AbiGii toxin family protein [Anaerolineae bacterium]|nr:nucleotidyl transferase AbiEii/AbiGii toxin family protein [Anaerolineae bacterium]
MTNPDFYPRVLYPFQDLVLRVINGVDTGFYLAGGTAASRGYLRHRFSDDLDLFVNDDNRFGLWAERLIQAIARQEDWRCEVLLKEERFARMNVLQGELVLKVECINDVPAHTGEIRSHPVLGRLDSPENILANKVTAALDREEPKDLADIWGFCCRMGLSLQEAIVNADSKAAGVFPADLSRVLCSATHADWEIVRWQEAPDANVYLSQLNELGEKLLLIG